MSKDKVFLRDLYSKFYDPMAELKPIKDGIVNENVYETTNTKVLWMTLLMLCWLGRRKEN